MRFILNFDMDDTLVATKDTVLDLGIKRASVLNENKFFNEFKEAIELGLDINDLSKESQKFIDEQIIAERIYMDVAAPSNMILLSRHNFVEQLMHLLVRYEHHLMINICTHRGDNESAVASTHNWLVKSEMRHCFTNIHSISYKQDKLEYLRSIYQEDIILLVDDNPFGSTKQVREPNEEVLVYDGCRKLPCHTNQKRYTGMKDIGQFISSKLN